MTRKQRRSVIILSGLAVLGLAAFLVLSALRESIALNKKLGVGHTPELKSGNPVRVNQVFGSQA